MRVRYGMNEKQIGRKAEPIMHAITILFALTTSFICLGLNMFNDSSLWCWINASPIGCQQSYNNGGVTNCERGDDAEIFRWAFYFVPLWVCIIGCMIIMFIIFISIRKQESKLKKYQFKAPSETTGNNVWEEWKQKREDDRRRHAQSRKVAWQGLRFVGVFYLTWTFATGK